MTITHMPCPPDRRPDDSRSDRDLSKQSISRIVSGLTVYLLVVAGILLLLVARRRSDEPLSVSLKTDAAADTDGPARRLQLQEEQANDGNVGTFHGFPVTYQSAATATTAQHHSTVHCVGENFGVDAWMYRSCQFRHLCYDMTQQELVVFPSPAEQQLQALLNERPDRPLVTIQSLLSNNNNKVALGPIPEFHPKGSTVADQRRQLEWFPVAISQLPEHGYYQLPSNVVLVPFSSAAGPSSSRRTTGSSGPSAWQDCLSMFTLLSMFGLLEPHQGDQQQQQQPEILVMDLNHHQSSSSIDKKSTFRQLLAAMGVGDHGYIPSAEALSLQLAPGQAVRGSDLVCARTGAAGVGMVANLLAVKPDTVHDLAWTHNAGVSARVQEFRDFVAEQGQVLVTSSAASATATAAVKSSGSHELAITFFESPINGLLDDAEPRQELASQDFQEAYKRVRSAFSDKGVAVERVQAGSLDFTSRARAAADSIVFVAFCGKHIVAATFLPRGASLVVYCDGGDGNESDRKASWSKRLDWKMLHNAAYFRTHWIALQSIRTEEGLTELLRLVQSEFDLARQQI